MKFDPINILPSFLILFQGWNLAWSQTQQGAWGFGISAALWIGYEILKKHEPLRAQTALRLSQDFSVLQADLARDREDLLALADLLKGVDIKASDACKKVETVMNVMQIKRMGM